MMRYSTEELNDVIIAAANYYHVSPTIVEKEYYVTIILKNIKENIPGILFKGGTSLSKCFKIINRFSEDIDLTLDTSHFTQSNKRSANKSVINICGNLGYGISNIEDVSKHAHGNYNCYNIEYPNTFSHQGIETYIKLEMAFIQRSYPDTTKKVTSIIGDYLIEIGQGEMLSKFDLEPFEIKVQSLERTLVDKVFALCDYFLRGETIRQSRHIYDICQLIKVIDWKNLNDLARDVRKERMTNKTCVSAQPGISIANTLRQIIETEYFKKDYEEVTIALLGEDVSYDIAILALKEISKKWNS